MDKSGNNQKLDALMGIVTHLGSSPFYLAVCVVMLLIRPVVFFKLIIAYAIIMLISSLIKLLFFKERPKKQIYKNIFERIDASSFPSAHSARAFALAALSCYFYGNLWIWTISMLIAALVAYSRIQIKKHYQVDVVMGAILGIISAAVAILI